MELFQSAKQRLGWDNKRFATVLILSLIILPASILLVTISRSSTFSGTGGFSITQILKGKFRQQELREHLASPPSVAPTPSPGFRTQQDSSNRNDEALLDGLLMSPEADEPSCLSRHQSYRKHSPHKPSSYLISKLRKYEDLHRQCGPGTKSYKRAIRKLTKLDRVDRDHSSSEEYCKYVIWLPANGLGNRMISIASTFLFALLTERVLLLHQRPDMEDLFCEPFPNSSWVLPVDKFPLQKEFWDEKDRHSHSIGSLMQNESSRGQASSYLFVNVNHGRYDGDNVFYCDRGQASIEKIPWLIMLSDQYYAPAFFVMKRFEKEVIKMFPEKQTVFHHLGRYLFHPSNQAWGLIKRFYRAYLEKADQRIGLQIRVFNPKTVPFQTVMDQILKCSSKENNILPKLDDAKPVGTSQSGNGTSSKAILAVSLYSEYYEHIKNMYWTKPTVEGDVIGVYQPSHEEYQKFGDNMHNMKAWAEISLLSTCDVLVTSAWSTFGYVAQGLGGLKPWILHKANDQNVPNPACVEDLSMEPCFHFPPTCDCDTDEKVDAGALVPYLRHCKDLNWGVKLVE
ncbi:unnamed protein product [Linum tenue]|uniref:Fucosyltransferase n=1 Tax=Linum tenue TaxID=586396 RepID=A0AAV0KGW7_9ROSI|nr:unnamed protein product [Linum tenue]